MKIGSKLEKALSAAAALLLAGRRRMHRRFDQEHRMDSDVRDTRSGAESSAYDQELRRRFRESAQQSNEQIEQFLDGQQVTQEALDLVISV
jgi:hypothetical protein